MGCVQYPEFTQISNFIGNYFDNYPDYVVNYSDRVEFWDILNQDLVETLLSQPIPTAFGFDYNLNEVVDALTVEIDVLAGSNSSDILLSSTVTGTIDRQAAIIEIDRTPQNLVLI